MLSATIITGLIIVVAGVVFAALGLGNVGVIDGSVKGVKLRTTSLGVLMIVVGALLSGFVATHLPEGYEIYADEPESYSRKILRVLSARGARPYLAVISVAALFLLVAVVISG